MLSEPEAGPEGKGRQGGISPRCLYNYGLMAMSRAYGFLLESILMKIGAGMIFLEAALSVVL